MMHFLATIIVGLSFDLWPDPHAAQAAFVAQVSREPAREIQSQPQVPRALNDRILFFTADWCGPCQAVKRDVFPSLKVAGWSIGAGPSNHIQVIDADADQELMAKWKIGSLPTFIRVSGGNEVRRSVGQIDAVGIGQIFYGK